MTANYKLYGRPGSGSLAVQIALEEMAAPYERIWVGREAAEVLAFRSVNATGKVPALVLPDGTVMFESAAMLIHLAGADTRGILAPRRGTSRHALFLQWMVFLSANLYEAALRMYYPARYSSRGEADAAAIREQGNQDFVDHLALISAKLAPYVLGADYSIADAYLYMLASWYPGEKSVLHAQLPKIGVHASLMQSRSAVAKVASEHGS